MTFKPDISAVSIWNEALALLPADPVESESEASVEARECRRFYKGVVATLLEAHHWNLARKRMELAAITNDRAEEWGFAYAKPDDLAYPAMVIPPSGAGVGGWIMQDYTYFLPTGQRAMQMAGTTIYSMIEAARLEYTTYDVTEADFTVSLKNAIVLSLAAAICMSITKDDKRALTLQAQARDATLQTIARDRNANNPTYGNKPTESEIVRGAGYDPNLIGLGYALDPVANPANTGN